MMNQNENNRWQEIRFYYFCLHLYQHRHDLSDLFYAIEAVAQIGNIKIQRIKALAGSLISEISNTPHKEELLYLASKAGVSPKVLKQFFGFSYRQMNYQANSCENTYFYPRLSPQDNQEICKFMSLLDVIKGGIL